MFLQCKAQLIFTLRRIRRVRSPHVVSVYPQRLLGSGFRGNPCKHTSVLLPPPLLLAFSLSGSLRLSQGELKWQARASIMKRLKLSSRLCIKGKVSLFLCSRVFTEPCGPFRPRAQVNTLTALVESVSRLGSARTSLALVQRLLQANSSNFWTFSSIKTGLS